MFNIKAYEIFIHNQVIGKAFYLKQDITEKLLESLLQFELAPSSYLKDIPSKIVSIKLKKLFPNTNKPKSVSFNKWFLYEFGYKYCNSCKHTVSILKYSTKNKNWDKLGDYCSDCDNKKCSNFRIKNPEYNKQYKILNSDYSTNYYIANADKIKERSKYYKINNPAKHSATSSKYRAKKVQATPPWLTIEHYNQILTFYNRAKKLEEETGIAYHVDHIIPLQGKTVCGLHVPWNLQVITATENMKKNNRVGEEFCQ